MRYASIPEIEDAVYATAKNVLGGVIKGDVYHFGTRPEDSDREDAIVKASAGTVTQIQDFSVYVNVFVKDIRNATNRYVMNRSRLEELMSYEEELIEAFNEANVGLMEARLMSPTQFVKVPESDVRQHFVSFNFSISFLTFCE